MVHRPKKPPSSPPARTEPPWETDRVQMGVFLWRESADLLAEISHLVGHPKRYILCALLRALGRERILELVREQLLADGQARVRWSQPGPK